MTYYISTSSIFVVKCYEKAWKKFILIFGYILLYGNGEMVIYVFPKLINGGLEHIEAWLSIVEHPLR